MNKQIKKEYSISKLKKKLTSFKKLTGYHTRNIPHKAHEWIIDYGLKKTGAILVNPMTGKLKKGDFKRSIVNKSFKILTNSFNVQTLASGYFFRKLSLNLLE